MLQCEIQILQNLIIRSKFCSYVLKEKTIALLKYTFFPDQFSVNGFFLFCFVCLFVVVLFLKKIPCQFVLGKREIWSQDFPQGPEVLV